jgi:hypothetical protein
MTTVKVIYRQKSALPLFVHTAFLCWGNYELYRIYQGTHPTFSTYLEKAGIYSANNTNDKDTAEKRPEERRTRHSGRNQDGEEAWRVPLPSFEMLIRPFRKD